MEYRSPVRARRQELGLSQEVAAQQAGISQTHFSQIENGKKQPSFQTMKKIAKALLSDESVLFFAKDCC